MREYLIRQAQQIDVPRIIDAVAALLAELRGTPEELPPIGSQDVCYRLVTGDINGAMFVAYPASMKDLLVGFLALSIQAAIHLGGRYALIQELWVRPEYRGDKVGAHLIRSAEDYCRAQEFTTLEVGLPGSTFHNLNQTSRFYARCGFLEVGARMRKVLV